MTTHITFKQAQKNFDASEPPGDDYSEFDDDIPDDIQFDDDGDW